VDTSFALARIPKLTDEVQVSDHTPAGLSGSKLLFVASTGGHLAQIRRLGDKCNASSDSMYYTFETEQSLSLLREKRRTFGPYVRPRDYLGLVRTALALYRLLKRERFDAVVSTGAGVALSAACAAFLRRRRMTYVESISRFEGPSTTGRIIQYLPWVNTYTQHAAWSSARWKVTGRLFEPMGRTPRSHDGQSTQDGYRSAEVGPLRILVSLGTIRPYRFDALVDAVLSVLRADDRVVWQLGATRREDLPGDVHAELPHATFMKELLGCDVFITHAGVGTVMQALEVGKYPLVVPRRPERHEHVDDHQSQVSEMLAREGFALVTTPDRLGRKQLYVAAAADSYRPGPPD
jgi:UDP-N-acetylglucosamine--N-acetylmuramyl-(pentapeptide) pyrophosphoryl-undecaprenol N-acetylglucosamine transferase